IVGARQHITATGRSAIKHTEIPTVTFTGRIGEVRIALENDPARSSRTANHAVVHGTLASLLVPHRSEPGLKSKRNARDRVVASQPRHRRRGPAVAIVISGSTVAGPA